MTMNLPNTKTVLPKLHSNYQVLKKAFTIFAGIKTVLHSLSRTFKMVESTVMELYLHLHEFHRKSTVVKTYFSTFSWSLNRRA